MLTMYSAEFGRERVRIVKPNYETDSEAPTLQK